MKLPRIIKKNKLIYHITILAILSILIIGILTFFVYHQTWIGIVFILLGFFHLLILRAFKIELQTLWPDLIFGAIDNGFLVLAAILGADFAGIAGAIVGSAAANSITDGFAGLFEGWTAEYLRKHRIKEQRSALTSALGKMAGCFFGAGIAFVILWSIFSL